MTVCPRTSGGLAVFLSEGDVGILLAELEGLRDPRNAPLVAELQYRLFSRRLSARPRPVTDPIVPGPR